MECSKGRCVCEVHVLVHRCAHMHLCERELVCEEGRERGGGGGSQTEAVDFTQHEDQSHSKPKGD